MSSFLSSPMFTVLLSFAGSGTVGAFIVAWSRRGVTNATEAKTKAEAAQVISNSASERVKEVQRELVAFKKWYREHAPWDREAHQKLIANNIEIGEPPELWMFYEVI